MLKSEIPFEVQSDRFLLKPLTVTDVTDRYAGVGDVVEYRE